MADINQIRLPDNSLYDIKDKTIRDEVKFKIYSSVEDILGANTSGSATIAGVWDAMTSPGILICRAIEFSSSEVPTSYGTVEIVKNSSANGLVYLHGITPAGGEYKMGILNDAPTGTWIFDSYNVETANIAAKTSVSASAWTTVASITLGAGTWELVANITADDPRAASEPVAVCSLRLMIGNNEVAGQPRTSFPTRGQLFTSGIVTAKVTLSQSTTINVQVYPSVTINVSARTNGPIWAKRIG